jgi:hypothetical protein
VLIDGVEREQTWQGADKMNCYCIPILGEHIDVHVGGYRSVMGVVIGSQRQFFCLPLCLDRRLQQSRHTLVRAEGVLGLFPLCFGNSTWPDRAVLVYHRYVESARDE